MNEVQNNTAQTQNGRAKKRVPKKFAAIYYSGIALVAVLLLIFSFVTYYFVGASTATSVDAPSAYDSYAKVLAGERNAVSGSDNPNETTGDVAADTIKGWLDSLGLAEAPIEKSNPEATKASEDQKITADYVNGNRVPSYAFMDMSADRIDFVLDRDTVADMTAGEDAGKEGLIYARAVKNFVIVLPGKGASNDAVLLMTHYDSSVGSEGASGATAVAAMLATVKSLQNAEFDNDLVFVLTDGRYENSVGAYAFKNQFVGFGNVVSRAKAVFNFDALTANGALTVLRTSDNGGGIMGGVLASSASVRLDSSVSALMSDRYTNDYNIFYNKSSEEWEKPSVDFVMTAGFVDAGSRSDTLQNVSADVLAQYASAMEGVARYFGNADLANIAEGLDVSSYTYFGRGFASSSVLVYVIAALLVLLIAANVILAVRQKAFGLEAALKGVGGVLLTMALSLAAYFVAYFLIGLLTVAFGAATMNMLTAAHLLSPAVLLPAMLFASAVSCGLYPLVKRMFKIKAADCVRGGALLQMTAAVVFGFVVPTAALPFLIVGLLNAFVMLATSLTKKVFASKFGFGIERLFLYTIPAMIGMPFLVQSMLTIGNLFATVTMPFLMVAFALLLSSITPYFDYLQPKLSDAFDKLPKHTIRVVEAVTEEKEDAVKKGKFTSVTENKVVNRKVAWRYHNWFGVTVLTAITVIALLIASPVSSAANAVIGNNVTSAYDYASVSVEEAMYDDAIVCYVDASYSSVNSYSWLIKDEALYREIRAVDGFDYYEWSYDSTLNAYRMTVTTDSLPAYESSDGVGLVKKASADESESGTCALNVSPLYGNYSQVKLTLGGIAKGNVLKVENGRGEIYSITFDTPASSVDVFLPLGAGDCTVKITTDSPSSVTATAREIVTSQDAPLALNGAREMFDRVQTYFAEKGKTVTVSYMLTARS